MDDRQRLNTSLRKYVAGIDMMMVMRMQYGLAEMNAVRCFYASKFISSEQCFHGSLESYRRGRATKWVF